MRKYTCDKYNKKKGICLSDEDKKNMMNEQYKKMKNLFLSTLGSDPMKTGKMGIYETSEHRTGLDIGVRPHKDVL